MWVVFLLGTGLLDILMRDGFYMGFGVYEGLAPARPMVSIGMI